LPLAFERDDDAGDGERRKSEGAKTALGDRLIEVPDDGTSSDGREADKLSWSVEFGISDAAVVTERRDEDGSWVNGILGVSEGVEVGLGRMPRDRTVPEEDCNGWRGRREGKVSVGVSRGARGSDEISECPFLEPNGPLLLTRTNTHLGHHRNSSYLEMGRFAAVVVEKPAA
jgi:hypothetical protein